MDDRDDPDDRGEAPSTGPGTVPEKWPPGAGVAAIRGRRRGTAVRRSQEAPLARCAALSGSGSESLGDE
jgi:hypothetical protein